jgi:hypothetical protein
MPITVAPGPNYAWTRGYWPQFFVLLLILIMLLILGAGDVVSKGS